jgi:hypothetical protein
MPYRQYTKCYNHTPGDKPFNKSDLVAFVAGTSAPGLIVALLAFLTGSTLGLVVGFIALALQYASTIVAVANEWLYHRLVCLTGDQCAVGVVEPLDKPSSLGEFDNDDYFDIRLLPHRHADEYNGPNGGPNGGFFGPPPNSNIPVGTPTWATNMPPTAGPSFDGAVASHPQNDIFLDGLQGSALLQPLIQDLPYYPVGLDEVPLFDFMGSPDVKVTRCTLHCEAEGNFWQAMKDYAMLQGTAVGVGAAGGAAAGCALGSIFGPIGCLIGAILGAILGGGAAAYIGANAAFNSDLGNYDDANVGDLPLGRLKQDDLVVVYGTHVYDGFHEGWHEFHPLKAIMKFTDYNILGAVQYLEWDPKFPDGKELPRGLTVTDMTQGMNSTAFAALAKQIRDQWCAAIGESFKPGTRDNQKKQENRWTIHPLVDGCQPAAGGSPPTR